MYLHFIYPSRSVYSRVPVYNNKSDDRGQKKTLPLIALLALSVGIDLVSSSARVTSVKSQQGVLVTDIRTQLSDPRFTWVR